MKRVRSRRTVAKGRGYERLAEKFLVDSGYSIIEKNWQAGHKEIDLIARKDKTVVFVEVKGAMSNEFGHPSERVDQRKRANLIEAAEKYIMTNDLQDCDFRFDLITFFDGQLEYYPNAFQRE